MYIRMDSREPEAVKETLSKKYGLIVDTELLPVGDYLFSDVCIERKTTADLLKSLRDGRIWTQLKDAKDNYPRVYVLLEGFLPYPYDKDTAVDELKAIGGLLGITMGWGIPVIPSNNLDQTCRIIAQAYSRSNKEKTEYLKPVKKKRFTVEEVKEDILCRIPGIGRQTARILLKKYPNLMDIINTSEADLIKVPRIGKKTAEWIKKVFE